MTTTAFVWILTYAVHSTVLIAFVWALFKLFPKVPLRLQESVWRVALFGGIVTATVTQIADVEPLGGRMALPASVHAAPATPVLPADPVVRRTITQHDAGDVRITTVQETKPHAAALPAAPAKPSAWPWVVSGFAVLGSALALLRLAFLVRRTRTQLRDRRDVIEDPILEKFFELCDAAGLAKDGKRRVRLTASSQLRSPVALLRREVVIPEQAIEKLSPAQQHSMVAHEIAHLQRRDPLWTVVVAVFEALFVFQPLNHLATRKLRELAEFQCDDWAAKVAGGGTHLAKCLAEVASWQGNVQPVALSVAMADRDSPVVRRITRLLHGRRKSATRAVSPALRIASGVMLLGSGLFLMPNIAPASPRSVSPRHDGLEHDDEPSIVTVRDLGGERGQRRSAITIDRDDERVEVHVDRRPELPAPPPVPSSDRFSFRGFYGDSFPFGEGCGAVEIDIDLDELHAEVEGTIGLGLPLSRGCARRLERVERERESAERSRKRLERRRHHVERRRERIEQHRERLERRREALERDRESSGVLFFEL